jgi:O-antigen/teichoic acid export membrane protein
LVRGKIFIASSIFGSISAILSLYMGFGLWSYVIMVLSISVSQFILHLILVRFRLKWKFKWTVLFVHLRRNSISFMSFFFEGFLNFLYTYILSTISFPNLAFYTRGDSLSKTFAFNISSVLDKNYVRIFNNSESTSDKLNLFSKIRVNLFLIMILATEFLYCSSSYIFSLLFGEKWIDGGLTFKFLVIAAFFIPTDKLFINLCFSKLSVKTNLYINMVKFILMLLPCFFVFYDFKFFLVSIIISRLTILFLNNFLLRKFFNFISIFDIYAVIILFLNIIILQYLGILVINFLDSNSSIFNISFYLVLSGLFYLLNKYLFFKFPFITDKFKF